MKKNIYIPLKDRPTLPKKNPENWNLGSRTAYYNPANDIFRINEYSALVLNVNESMINKENFFINKLTEKQNEFDFFLEILMELLTAVPYRKEGELHNGEDFSIFCEVVQSNEKSTISEEDKERCDKYPTIFPADIKMKMANYRIWIFIKKSFNIDENLLKILTNAKSSKKKKEAVDVDKNDEKGKKGGSKKSSNKSDSDNKTNKPQKSLSGSSNQVSNQQDEGGLDLFDNPILPTKRSASKNNTKKRKANSDDEDGMEEVAKAMKGSKKKSKTKKDNTGEKAFSIPTTNKDPCGFNIYNKIYDAYKIFMPIYTTNSGNFARILDNHHKITTVKQSDFRDDEKYKLTTRMSPLNAIMGLYDIMRTQNETIFLPSEGDQGDGLWSEEETPSYPSDGYEKEMKDCLHILSFYFDEERNIINKYRGNNNNKNRAKCYTFPFPENVLKMTLMDLSPSSKKILPQDQKVTLLLALRLYSIFENYLPNFTEEEGVSRTSEGDDEEGRGQEDPLARRTNFLHDGDRVSVNIFENVDQLKEGEENLDYNEDLTERLLEGKKLNINQSSLGKIQQQNTPLSNQIIKTHKILGDEMRMENSDSRGVMMTLNNQHSMVSNSNNKKTFQDLLKENSMDFIINKPGDDSRGESNPFGMLLLDDPVIPKKTNHQLKGVRQSMLDVPSNQSFRRNGGKSPLTIKVEDEIWKNAFNEFQGITEEENSPTKKFFIVSSMKYQNIFNTENFQNVTVERAREMKRNFAIDTINGLKSMTKSASHSDEMKKVFEALDKIERSKKVMSDEFPVEAKGLSLFANYVINKFSILEQTYRVHHNHSLAFLLITQCYSVFDFSTLLFGNILITGGKSIGKSFCMQIAESCMLPGTCASLTHSTAHSEMFNSNTPIEARLNIHEEMPPFFKQSSQNNSMQKNIMTSKRMRVKRLQKNALGNIENEDFKRSINQLYILATNETMSSLDQATLSRFYHIPLPDAKRFNLTMADLLNAFRDKATKKRDETITEIFQEQTRFLQVMHCMVNLYINSKIFEEPTLAVTKKILPIITEELGGRLRATRSCETLIGIVKCLVKTSAIIRLYFDPDNKRFFTYENFLMIDPFLHDSLEIVLTALAIAGIFDESAVDIINVKIRDIILKGEMQKVNLQNIRQEYLSKFKNNSKKNQTNVNQQSHTQQEKEYKINSQHSAIGKDPKRGSSGDVDDTSYDPNYIEFKMSFKNFVEKICSNQPPSKKIRVNLNKDESVSYEESCRTLSTEQVAYELEQIEKTTIKAYPRLCMSFDKLKPGKEPLFFQDDKSCVKDPARKYLTKEEFDEIITGDCYNFDHWETGDEYEPASIEIEKNIARYNNNGEKCDFKVIERYEGSVCLHYSFLEDNQDDFEKHPEYLDSKDSIFSQVHTSNAMTKVIDILHRRIFNSETRKKRILSGIVASYSLAPYIMGVINCKPNKDRAIEFKNSRKNLPTNKILDLMGGRNSRKVKRNYDERIINDDDDQLLNEDELLSKALTSEKDMTIKDFEEKYNRDPKMDFLDLDEFSMRKRLIEINYIPTKRRIQALTDKFQTIDDGEGRNEQEDDKDNKDKYPENFLSAELETVFSKKISGRLEQLKQNIKERNPLKEDFTKRESAIMFQILQKISKFHGVIDQNGGKTNEKKIQEEGEEEGGEGEDVVKKKYFQLMQIEKKIREESGYLRNSLFYELLDDCDNDEALAILDGTKQTIKDWFNDNRAKVKKEYLTAIENLSIIIFKREMNKMLDDDNNSVSKESFEKDRFTTPRKSIERALRPNDFNNSDNSNRDSEGNRKFAVPKKKNDHQQHSSSFVGSSFDAENIKDFGTQKKIQKRKTIDKEISSHHQESKNKKSKIDKNALILNQKRAEFILNQPDDSEFLSQALEMKAGDFEKSTFVSKNTPTLKNIHPKSSGASTKTKKKIKMPENEVLIAEQIDEEEMNDPKYDDIDMLDAINGEEESSSEFRDDNDSHSEILNKK